MKSTIIIQLFTICVAGNLMAQTKYPISIYFNSKEIDMSQVKSLNNIKHGDFYQVIVTGINSNYYKIIIDTNDTILETVGTIPIWDSLPITDVSELLSRLPSLVTSSALKKSELKGIEEESPLLASRKNECLVILEKEKEYLNNLVSKYNEYTSKMIEFGGYNYRAGAFNFSEFDDVRKEMDGLFEELDNRKVSFETSVKDNSKSCGPYKALYTSIQEKYKEIILLRAKQKNSPIGNQVLVRLLENLLLTNEEYITQLQSDFYMFRNDIYNWQAIRIGLLPNVLYTDSVCLKAISCGDTAINKIIAGQRELMISSRELSSKISKYKINYIVELSQITSRFINYSIDNIISTANEVKEVYDVISGKLDTLEKNIGPEATSNYLKIVSAIMNSSETGYIDLPRQFVGDRVKLKIRIEPRDPDIGLNSYRTYLEFPLRKRFEFGSGSSLYIGLIRNDSYSVQSHLVNDSIIYSIVEEDSDDYEVGSYVHANFIWNIEKKLWGLGCSVGPGISFTKTVRPRVLTGLSISYGKLNKGTLSLGSITGYVDRLSNSYSPNTDYKNVPANVVVSRIKTGLFASLGFVHSF